jgi:hypothetical protein
MSECANIAFIDDIDKELREEEAKDARGLRLELS